MNTLSEITDFLNKEHTIAIAGVSRNKLKFARIVYDELKAKGYSVVPVNSQTDKIGEDKCYQKISELPADIEHLLIITNKENTKSIVKDSIGHNIRNIWIHLRAHSKEAIDLANKNNINLIFKQCVFMFIEPVQDVHKVHKTIKKIFGNLPK